MSFVSPNRAAEAALVVPGVAAANNAIAGLRAYTKFGYNAAVGSTKEIVSTLGGDQAYLSEATAAQVKVSSGSANDTNTDGTGARTLYIEGLDANFNLVSETVVLTGQSAATSALTYSSLHRAYVVTAGSGGTNAGVLYVGAGTVTTGVPATKYLAIPAGEAQTLTTYFRVPVGQTAFVIGGSASTYDNNTDYATIRLEIRNPDDFVWRTQYLINLFRGSETFAFQLPLTYPQKTEMRVTAASSANTIDVSGAYQFLLVDNT